MLDGNAVALDTYLRSGPAKDLDDCPHCETPIEYEWDYNDYGFKVLKPVRCPCQAGES